MATDFNLVQMGRAYNALHWRRLEPRTTLPEPNLLTRKQMDLIKAVLAEIGIRDISESDICALTPEILISMAIEARKGLPVYSKAVLLAVAREATNAIPMDPNFPAIELCGFDPLAQLPAEPDLSDAWPQIRGAKRAGILLQNGEGYLKPIFGAESRGVANIIRCRNGLKLRTKDNLLLALIQNSFADGCFSNSGFRLEQEADDRLNIYFGEKVTSGVSDLAKFFFYYETMICFEGDKLSEDLPFGPTVFEPAIRTPLIGNATWEIRVITQSAKAVASYAKIGASSYIGNIAAGGYGLSSLAAIRAAYTTFSKGWGRALMGDGMGDLPERYLQQAFASAETIACTLSGLFSYLKDRYLPDYPFESIPASDFAVDFMAEPKGKRLVPYVMDINFYYVMSGLAQVDNKTCLEVQARSENIRSALLNDLLRFARQELAFT